MTIHRETAVNPIADRRRLGITLIEVLISIGVMTIGLLGMAALVPLGRLELAEGERLDNISTIGRAAFRDLSIRGYLRPEMWADPISGRSIVTPGPFFDEYSPATNTPTARQFPSTAGASGLIGPPYAPIVIDPLMIAPTFFQEPTNANVLTTTEQEHRQHCVTFPYSLRLNGWSENWPEATAPRIARTTLRTVPASVVGKPKEIRFLSTTMKYDVAQRFFRASDDLSIDVPTDKVLRPVQLFAVTSNSLSNLTMTATDGISKQQVLRSIAYRKFRGDYSWFLVAEPGLAEAYWGAPESMPVVSGPGASLLTAKQFRVWTVVCHKRDLRETSQMDLAVDRNVGERMAWVDFIDRNTARLRVHDANRASAEEALQIKPNHWIAVVGAYSEPALGGAARYVMEWYRVVSAGEDVQNASADEPTVWYREVTLVGRDFANLGFEFIDANGFSKYDDYTVAARATGVVSAEPLTAWGILVTGARGVYEKTVYVDRPSSWSME